MESNYHDVTYCAMMVSKFVIFVFRGVIVVLKGEVDKPSFFQSYILVFRSNTVG